MEACDEKIRVWAKINIAWWLEHVLFFRILGTMIPTHSYFSEGSKPPTSYDY
jgi:hypothetical protein